MPAPNEYEPTLFPLRSRIARDEIPEPTSCATLRSRKAISAFSICGFVVSPKPALVLIVSVNAPLLLAITQSLQRQISISARLIHEVKVRIGVVPASLV